MELEESHRHTVGVRIVLGLVHLEALLANSLGPFGVRQSALHVAARLEERGNGWSFGIVGKPFGRRLQLHAAAAGSKRGIGVAVRICATCRRGLACRRSRWCLTARRGCGWC